MSSKPSYQPEKSEHQPDDAQIAAFVNEITADVDFRSPFDLRPRLATKTAEMLKKGRLPSSCTRLITSVADRVMHSGIEHAISKLGPAPDRWMFMVMGSEGRNEQTLRTDQDSAIVCTNKSDTDYFIRLGEIVSEGLDAFGFLFCKGNVMASNPKWVMSLESWKNTFSGWVEEPEPMAIMQACIFFDFRCGYGDQSLEQELTAHIRKLLKSQSGLFFYHMAKNALSHSVPLGWFGRISRKASTSLDIKKAMLPLTDHARIYGLSKGVNSTNTLERISELDKLGAYRGATSSDARNACEFMTGLRLKHQIDCINEGKEPDNIIDPSSLTDQEKTELVKCLQISKDLQQSIEINFRAGY